MAKFGLNNEQVHVATVVGVLYIYIDNATINTYCKLHIIIINHYIT